MAGDAATRIKLNGLLSLVDVLCQQAYKSHIGAAQHKSPFPHFVLYVDDDPHECELLRTLAEAWPQGPLVKTVGSFEAGQAFFTSGSVEIPALLLLDYHLGVHTGVDYLKWLSGQPLPRFPVAMFSNCAMEEDIALCYQSGADYFIRKPASCAGLQTILETFARCMSCEKPDFEPLRLLDEYCPPLSGMDAEDLQRRKNPRL